MELRLSILAPLVAGALALGAGALGTLAHADGFGRGSFKDTAVEPPFNWSGFYIGANLGYAWSKVDGTVVVPAGSVMIAGARAITDAALNGSTSGNGLTGGIGLGWNYQTGGLVLGVEGDVNFLDTDGRRSSGRIASGASFGEGNDRIDTDWLATLRGRLGLTTGRTLFYVTGGAAFTDASFSRTLDWSFADACPAANGGMVRCHSGGEKFRTGWTVGGGIEHALSRNWTIKAEYLFADFGSQSFRSDNAGVAVTQWIDHKIELDMHVARLGVNYKF